MITRIQSMIASTMVRRGSGHLVLALCGLGLLPCGAQEGEKVHLQFLSFPRAIDPAPVELVIGEDKTLEVAIPTNELSAVYKVPRQTTWALGETVPGEDGKPAFRVFGKARALAGSTQLILLIRKGNDYADGFEVIAIDNRVANFGGGKFLFVNAAKVAIAGEVGTKRFSIQPGKHVIIKPEPLKGKHLCHTALFYDKNGEARPFFQSRWPVSDQARGLIFFYHDPHTLSLRMHSIRDFL